MCIVAYWLWLDVEVGRSFSKQQWTLPTRIYASPVELYRGVELRLDDVTANLQRLGYVERAAVDGPGQYRKTGNRLRIRTRGYAFPDGAEPARDMTLTFDRTGVAAIVDARSAAPLAIVRLEPEEIGSVHARSFEDRVLVALADVPESFIAMLLEVEDRRFYQHIGIDPLGIARAAYRNIVSGRVAEGGSTITQQLVKNLYLSNERSWVRKLREAMMALSIERRFSKDEILEAYINEIFLGQDGNRAIHGFGLAAEFYFGQQLSHLDLAQTAMLVGMVKAPSAYNPKRHRDAAKQRRAAVLGLLFDRGLISRADFEHARASKIAPTTLNADRDHLFGAVVELVKAHLRRDYRDDDLLSAGLKVYTTIDARIQRLTQRAAAATVSAIEKRRQLETNSLQTAVVVVDPHSADIKSLVGGRAGYTAGFNRALNANRPIGSLVKPFVYAAALAQTDRFNVLSQLEDEPVTLQLENGDTWSPKNYDGKFHGPVSVRQAFVHSYNLATVNLGLTAGLGDMASRLKQFGLKQDLASQPSLLLGALEMSPLEVSQDYQAIANDGFKIPLRVIRVVSDAGNVSLTRYPPRVQQVMADNTAYLVQYLLMGAVADGTARAAASSLASSMPLAGKTGTSNDSRDSWFVGFGRNYLATVWVGRDDNATTGLTGASGALGVWIEIMRRIGVLPLELGSAEGIEWQYVNEDGTAVLPEHCSGVTRIPLAIPHGLPLIGSCGGDAGADDDKGLWQRMRGIFR